MLRIAVDAMGGDHAPRAIVEGCLDALHQNADLEIVLVGREDDISTVLEGKVPDRVSIFHAPSVISCEEAPLIAIRSKKDSSMLQGLDMLKRREVNAFVSAGSTGALMAGALFHVGRIKGIHRPALAPLLPTDAGQCILIDSGANAECKAQFLLQFGLMGSIYMEHVMGVKHPKVGLLNIGAEEEKGSMVYQDAHQLLKTSGLHFVGNVEARDVLEGHCDVLVSDGFAGNVLLKSIEGTAMYVMRSLKRELTRNIITKFGTLFLMKGLKNIKKRMDYTEYGGAVLLGIDGCVIKAHGSSKTRSFTSAITQSISYVKRDIVNTIAMRLAESPDMSR